MLSWASSSASPTSSAMASVASTRSGRVSSVVALSSSGSRSDWISRAVVPPASRSRSRCQPASCCSVGPYGLVESRHRPVTRSGAVLVSAIATIPPSDRPTSSNRSGSSSSSRSTWPDNVGSVSRGVCAGPRSRPVHSRAEQFIPGSSTRGSDPESAWITASPLVLEAIARDHDYVFTVELKPAVAVTVRCRRSGPAAAEHCRGDRASPRSRRW